MRLFTLLLVVLSCTHKEPIDLSIKCDINRDQIDKRALAYNIIAKNREISKCYQNYLKLNELESSFSACLLLRVSKSGRVRSVKLSNDRKPLPKDLRMCVEQEIWSSNFSHLQLDRAQELQIPLFFKQ